MMCGTTDELSQLESEVLASICSQEMWKHCEAFNTLHRASGTEDDYRAVRYIEDYLAFHGIETEVYKFKSLLSYPIRASLRCVTPEEREIRCKTRAFSGVTPPQGVEAELIYVPTQSAGVGLLEAAVTNEYAGVDARGKVVLTERGGPDGVWDAQKAGAIAHIHIWPSDENVIHEMICSPVWGTPTPESSQNLPTIPALAVTRKDGLWLKCCAERASTRVLLRNDAERVWRDLLLPVATITGTREPEKFVLVGGHLDSWYVGVTDNATGNACCLELARVLHKVKDRLERSVKIAWWPGHSYGRYSGSTWFCDTFWQQIHDHCIAYDNIDSPGVLDATDYTNITAMAEAAQFAGQVVLQITGQQPTASRPARAGDQSFWGTGTTSIFMLLSNRPAKDGAAVGGSGGGWWWHTEYDTLDKADPNRLKMDTQIHALAVLRLLSSRVLPFRLSALAAQILSTLEAYQKTAGSRFELSAAATAAECFAEAAKQFDMHAETLAEEGTEETQRAFSKKMLQVLRHVIPVVYTQSGAFDQDPATPSPTLPGLARVAELDFHEPYEDEYMFCLTRLMRERNRVVKSLLDAVGDMSLGK